MKDLAPLLEHLEPRRLLADATQLSTYGQEAGGVVSDGDAGAYFTGSRSRNGHGLFHIPDASTVPRRLTSYDSRVILDVEVGPEGRAYYIHGREVWSVHHADPEGTPPRVELPEQPGMSVRNIEVLADGTLMAAMHNSNTYPTTNSLHVVHDGSLSAGYAMPVFAVSPEYSWKRDPAATVGNRMLLIDSAGDLYTASPGREPMDAPRVELLHDEAKHSLNRDGYQIVQMQEAGHLVLFQAWDDSQGWWVTWRTDGTARGTYALPAAYGTPVGGERADATGRHLLHHDYEVSLTDPTTGQKLVVSGIEDFDYGLDYVHDRHTTIDGTTFLMGGYSSNSFGLLYRIDPQTGQAENLSKALPGDPLEESTSVVSSGKYVYLSTKTVGEYIGNDYYAAYETYRFGATGEPERIAGLPDELHVDHAISLPSGGVLFTYSGGETGGIWGVPAEAASEYEPPVPPRRPWRPDTGIFAGGPMIEEHEAILTPVRRMTSLVLR